jgi:DNA-binding CsgD family transcriptional regulator
MPAGDARLKPWLDIVSDLIRRPLSAFPHRELLPAFAASFDAEPSWNWVNRDGSFGFDLLHPPPNWPQADELDYWQREGMKHHPLIKWFTATGDWRAQSIGRVPSSVANHRDRAIVKSQLRHVGLDEQLSIPYKLGSNGAQRTFVLARTGEDFSEEDLDLARRLQPLFALLSRQVTVLSRIPAPSMGSVGSAELTGRELAVLRLLADGHTAVAIANRLASSPRTVHKHLEHIYRKLGVRDRLKAIRAAEVGGLIELPRQPASTPRCSCIFNDFPSGSQAPASNSR